MERKPRLKPDNKGMLPMLAQRLILRTALPALLFIALLPLLAAAQQGTVVATVININGRLDYRENETAAWKPAKKLDALYQGYQLRTQTGNKAMIIYNATHARVLINENTQIEVQAQVSRPGGKPSGDRTKLMMGQVYSKLKSGNYEVETPSSVASVRGTEFDARYDIQTDTATYLVLESTVELMNQLGSVLLNQYQTANVQRNNQPGSPQQLSRNSALNLVKWTDGVEPRWRLNMVPEGGDTHEAGTTFTIGLALLNAKTLNLDSSGSFELKSFAAGSDIIEFSTDNGKTWSGAPRVRLLNGLASLRARVKNEGAVDITAEADNAEPAVRTITIAKAKDRKQIEILFSDPNGTEQKTLILELEEK